MEMERVRKSAPLFPASPAELYQSQPASATDFMNSTNLIEQELASTEAAWKNDNDVKIRIYARRTVALADVAWLAKQSNQLFRGDAMEPLRRIQQDLALPLPNRQTSERLSTAGTRNDSAPLRTGPHRPPRNDYCVPHCCVAKTTPHRTSFLSCYAR